MQLKQVITESVPISQYAPLECLFCSPHLTGLTCIFILLVPLQYKSKILNQIKAQAQPFKHSCTWKTNRVYANLFQMPQRAKGFVVFIGMLGCEIPTWKTL